MSRLINFILLISSLLLCGCATTEQANIIHHSGTSAQKAIRLHQEGNIKEALQYYAEAIEEAPTPQLHNGAGAALLENEHPKKALDEFNRALIFMPASADLHINKGTAEILLGDDEAAEDSFNKALSYDAKSPAAINGKALIMLHRKEYESALILLTKAERFAPTNRTIKFNKALSLEGAGLFEDAETLLTLLLKSKEDDAEALNARGVVRMKQKRFDLAEEDFTAAITQSPATGIYYYNKATLQQHLMKYDKAIANYTRSVAYDPTNPATYINRGESYFLLGKKKRGCYDLKKACEMGLCKKFKSYKHAQLCSEE